ncbi:MAG TPA: CBM35 domain-containing protein [Polyangia bacterium]|nr:CBM35 domain-containing protein [Polyangia bacterium]
MTCLAGACLAGLSACGWRASDEISTTSGILSPASLPDIQYHLTARPWTPLETPRDAYLDRIEGIVRFEATLQNGAGAIIDPVAHQEWQYATPYFANSLGLLLSAGRAQDLLESGVAAMNSASSQMAVGNGAIPQQHGNFFIAPMADALSLYQPLVDAAQIATWRSRMRLPVANLIQTFDHNWRGYAMKGQWYRFQQGLVPRADAVTFIEDGWINTQRSRFTGNALNLYHDTSSDPDTFAYDAASRANLWNMLVRGYNGASAAEMSRLIRRGTQSDLLLQDATGQAPFGGRSGLHSWNDVYTGLGFEMMAERANADGNDRLAGQYRHSAMLALKSVDRWRSGQGFYFVTKNHFDIGLRVRYADYSQLTNYNGNVMYHMAEAWRARQSPIEEQPAPVEIGGYALDPDPQFAIAVANAGGMMIQAALRGTTTREFGQFWTTLGISRFSRVNWDSRLGPSDGVRDAGSALGVSYAPTFLESGNWSRLASMPQRYQAKLSVTFTHPLLVRCRLDYAPRAGQSGPTFSDDLIITPDGVLSTITSSAAAGNFGVTWPVLTNDGAPLTNSFTQHIAAVSFAGGGDQQNFIALHPSPTLVTNLGTLRSSYGDLRPVRVLSGAGQGDVQTFVYPRSPGDPGAESVRTSFTRDGNGGFSSVLGRVVGDLYIGRTSAGGVGSAVDLDDDGENDVTFSTSCGFILQLANGRVTAVEADRVVTAVVQGQTVTLSPFSPLTLIPAVTTSFEAESATLAGEAKLQACAACSGGQRVGFLGNTATSGAVTVGTLTFTNVNVPAPGSYVVSLFYTSQDDRTGTLTVNGVAGSPIAFPSSGNFDTVARLDAVVSLNAGDNTIAIGNNTSRAPSIDRLVVNIQ